MGRNHFQSLFKVDGKATNAKIVRITQYFPSFVNDEDNNAPMEEVLEEELNEVLHSFQKDKSLRPNGWSLEFFLGLYEIIGSDLLKVVEESRESRKILSSFNSTFIALIPKTDNPQSFDDF